MRLWRITLRDDPDPWRPRRCAHRWSTDSVSVTYASRCPALAVSEILVYVRHVDELQDRILHEAEYGGGSETLEPLPERWNQWPHDPGVQAAGDAWVHGGSGGALEVPTILLPTGSNVMLNQAHEDFRTLRVVAQHPLDRYQR